MPEDREWRTLQILEEHSKGIERKKTDRENGEQI